MKEEKGEGIILHSLEFKEQERIVSIFTPHSGIISLIVKQLSKKNLTLVNLTTPFCQIEFIYRKGKSDLYRFIDGTILDLHLPLRQSLPHLIYGGKMLQAIRSTQFPGKPAPFLYQLLLSYIKKLPIYVKPESLYSSFQLKLLKHEGLFDLTQTCNKCKKNPPLCLVYGESFCSTCSPSFSTAFTTEEWNQLIIFTHSRKFDYITDAPLESAFQKKIENLFQMSLK